MTTTQISTLLEDLADAGIELVEAIGQNTRLLNSWRILLQEPLYRVKKHILEYVDKLNGATLLGTGRTVDWRGNFREAFPEIPQNVFDGMEIHHAIPRGAINTHYPTLGVTPYQLHSVENLRGIPRTTLGPNGGALHTEIGVIWNAFYRQNPNASLQDLLDFARTIDDQFGHLFVPPIR
jgi:hypothetical protein